MKIGQKTYIWCSYGGQVHKLIRQPGVAVALLVKHLRQRCRGAGRPSKSSQKPKSLQLLRCRCKLQNYKESSRYGMIHLLPVTIILSFFKNRPQSTLDRYRLSFPVRIVRRTIHRRQPFHPLLLLVAHDAVPRSRTLAPHAPPAGRHPERHARRIEDACAAAHAAGEAGEAQASARECRWG
jgi:hypothetical protein